MPKVETEITIRLNDDGTADLRGMASDAVVDWEERHGRRVVIAVALAAKDENGEVDDFEFGWRRGEDGSHFIETKPNT